MTCGPVRAASFAFQSLLWYDPIVLYMTHFSGLHALFGIRRMSREYDKTAANSGIAESQEKILGPLTSTKSTGPS